MDSLHLCVGPGPAGVFQNRPGSQHAVRRHGDCALLVDPDLFTMPTAGDLHSLVLGVHLVRDILQSLKARLGGPSPTALNCKAVPAEELRSHREIER